MTVGKRSAGSGVISLLAAVFAITLLPPLSSANAAGGLTAILKALQHGNVYVSQSEIRAGHARSGDVSRLEAQASDAANQGLPEKFAILSSFPGNSAGAAHQLRTYLNFAGTLVMVGPHGIGVSSGTHLSQAEDQSVAQSVAASCLTTSYTSCALAAGQQALAKYKNDQSTTQRNAGIVWAVVLLILAVVIFGLVFFVWRRRNAMSGHLNELRTAAGNTLALADTAIQQIESEMQGKSMPAQVRAEYDRALAMRDQARQEIDRATTSPVLTQANQDAAQAVLALQGVMRQLGIQSELANPLEAPGRRCFYCGREDRPPYTAQTISDGKGNTMEIQVCSVDQQRLAQGRTPQVATVAYQGAQVPWWAVPNNPWYYSYGGPTWQYWLPFMIGMDVGGWYAGGWANPGWYGGGSDWDNDGGWNQAGGDPGGAAQAPQDAGGVDYGQWDNSSGGGWDNSGGGNAQDAGAGWSDTGGSGWDSGGGDSGGDWGGGGDSGGGWS